MNNFLIISLSTAEVNGLCHLIQVAMTREDITKLICRDDKKQVLHLLERLRRKAKKAARRVGG